MYPAAARCKNRYTYLFIGSYKKLCVLMTYVAALANYLDTCSLLVIVIHLIPAKSEAVLILAVCLVF